MNNSRSTTGEVNRERDIQNMNEKNWKNFCNNYQKELQNKDWEQRVNISKQLSVFEDSCKEHFSSLSQLQVTLQRVDGLQIYSNEFNKQNASIAKKIRNILDGREFALERAEKSLGSIDILKQNMNKWPQSGKSLGRMKKETVYRKNRVCNRKEEKFKWMIKTVGEGYQQVLLNQGSSDLDQIYKDIFEDVKGDLVDVVDAEDAEELRLAQYLKGSKYKLTCLPDNFETVYGRQIGKPENVTENSSPSMFQTELPRVKVKAPPIVLVGPNYTDISGKELGELKKEINLDLSNKDGQPIELFVKDFAKSLIQFVGSSPNLFILFPRKDKRRENNSWNSYEICLVDMQSLVVLNLFFENNVNHFLANQNNSNKKDESFKTSISNNSQTSYQRGFSKMSLTDIGFHFFYDNIPSYTSKGFLLILQPGEEKS